MSQPTTLKRIPGGSKPRDNQIWLRLAIIIGLVLYVFFVARRTTKTWYWLDMITDPTVLVLPALVGLYCLLRWPQASLVGLVVVSLVVPFSIGTGTGTSINAGIIFLAALLGLWVFDMIARKKEIAVARSRTVFPLVALVLAAVLSFLVGQLPWFVFGERASVAAQLGGLSVFIFAAGAYLLVGNQVKDLRWLRWMVWTYLALGGIYILTQIIPGMGNYGGYFVQRSAFSHSLFWLWLAALAFSQVMFNQDLKPVWRGALTLELLGVFYLILVRDSTWTSGWLPAAVAVSVILFASRSRWAWASIAGGVAIVVLKLDSLRNLLFSSNQYSLDTRLEAWRIIGQIIAANPILGLGPANYYYYTPLFGILGYTVQFNSHNNYIDIIAQVGLLGLAFFLWFAWELWWVGWKLRSVAPAGFERAYVLGALGGLAAMLVSGMFGDWVLPFIYNIGLNGFRASLLGWAFLGGLYALERKYSQPASRLPEK